MVQEPQIEPDKAERLKESAPEPAPEPVSESNEYVEEESKELKPEASPSGKKPENFRFMMFDVEFLRAPFLGP